MEAFMPTLSQARAWYVDVDPVHDFAHIERVFAMAERLAQAEGADLEIVRAAALLHDAEGTTPGAEERASHHFSSAEFAARVLAQEGWPPQRIAAVQHCIRAHRFRDEREPPATIEAKVLFDADKLDVLGAIGAARTIAYAVLAGQPVFSEPSDRFKRTGEKEPGEPHSAYHEYLFKLCKIKGRLFTPTARRLAEERDEYLRQFFVQLAAEIKGER
jgi:uncharacterized protein